MASSLKTATTAALSIRLISSRLNAHTKALLFSYLFLLQIVKQFREVLLSQSILLISLLNCLFTSSGTGIGKCKEEDSTQSKDTQHLHLDRV